MTQAQRVLADLQRGPVDVTDYPAGFRLGARIFDLRRAGHEIESRDITLPGGATVAQYRLSTPAVVERASAALPAQPFAGGATGGSSVPEITPWACKSCGGRPATEPTPLLGGMGSAHCPSCIGTRLFTRRAA